MMTLSSHIKTNLEKALAEDVRYGDITTESTVPAYCRAQARIEARQEGVVSGLKVAREVFRLVDSSVAFRPVVADGDSVESGSALAQISGPARAILTGERLALNLLMRLSGVATATKKLVDILDKPSVKLLDTRKTTPLWRELEKEAVRHGGGHNHRMGLFDMVLIKENHIRVAGSAQEAVIKARLRAPSHISIEVEVESLDECRSVLQANPDVILLDNMSPKEVEEAVKICRDHHKPILIEVSGGITEDTIHRYGQTGVDRISVGAVTHSASAFDLSLLIEEYTYETEE